MQYVCVCLNICLVLSIFPRLDVIELTLGCNGVAPFHKGFNLIIEFVTF